MKLKILVATGVVILTSPNAWAQALDADAIKRHIVGWWAKTDDAGNPECIRHTHVVSVLPNGSYVLFSGTPIRLVKPSGQLNAGELPYVLGADELGNLPDPQVVDQYIMPNQDTLVTRPLRATGALTEFKRCAAPAD